MTQSLISIFVSLLFIYEEKCFVQGMRVKNNNESDERSLCCFSFLCNCCDCCCSNESGESDEEESQGKNLSWDPNIKDGTTNIIIYGRSAEDQINFDGKSNSNTKSFLKNLRERNVDVKKNVMIYFAHDYSGKKEPKTYGNRKIIESDVLKHNATFKRVVIDMEKTDNTFFTQVTDAEPALKENVDVFVNDDYTLHRLGSKGKFVSWLTYSWEPLNVILKVDGVVFLQDLQNNLLGPKELPTASHNLEITFQGDQVKVPVTQKTTGYDILATWLTKTNCAHGKGLNSKHDTLDWQLPDREDVDDTLQQSAGVEYLRMQTPLGELPGWPFNKIKICFSADSKLYKARKHNSDGLYKYHVYEIEDVKKDLLIENKKSDKKTQLLMDSCRDLEKEDFVLPHPKPKWSTGDAADKLNKKFVVVRKTLKTE